MDWHCGLLDAPTFDAGSRNPIRFSNWHSLSDEHERELRIWLAMPGLSLNYHCHTLERDAREIRPFMGGYAELEEDVLMNWVSASREDCKKLGWIRPKKGDLPLITKFQIRRDWLRGGKTQTELAKEYGVWPATVNKLAWGLPDEIEQVPPRLSDLLARDVYVSGFNPASARRLAQQEAVARRNHEVTPLSPELQEKVAESIRRLTDQAKATAERESNDKEEERARLMAIMKGVPPSGSSASDD